MRSERQALAEITKLHFLVPYSEDGPASEGFCPQCDVVYPCKTAAILSDVQPESATAGGTIDRDALMRALVEFPWLGQAGDVYRLADAILALVRPVESVVLTREEAAMAAEALRWAS